jgi:ABC-type glutathione transport system ATPase component
LPTPEQDVKYFGELEAAKRQAEILPALQILEPRLRKLSLVPLAGESVLHGDIDGLPRLVPVPFMGEGMRRVLSIVLAIANAPGGVVLVDEIENGLHYSVQVDVWKAIARAARDADVQMFATTHSWECIEAAHHPFKEAGPYEFRYYRLDRRGTEITVKSLDERMLDAVEKSDLEVR